MTSAQEITALLTEIQKVSSIHYEAVNRRKGELRREFDLRMTTDAVITAHETEYKRWRDFLHDRLAETFLPGSVIKIYGTSVSAIGEASHLETFTVGVVETVSNTTITVLYARDRGKQDTLQYTEVIELASYDELPENTAEEKKLKRRIGRLIAKVRLHEW